MRKAYSEGRAVVSVVAKGGADDIGDVGGSRNEKGLGEELLPSGSSSQSELENQVLLVPHQPSQSRDGWLYTSRPSYLHGRRFVTALIFT